MGRETSLGQLGICASISKALLRTNIPVALVRVEPHRETSNISDGIRRASRALYGGEAGKDWGGLADFCQDASRGELWDCSVQGELSVCCDSASVDDTLWDALVVKVVDLEDGDRAKRDAASEERHYLSSPERVVVAAPSPFRAGQAG